MWRSLTKDPNKLINLSHLLTCVVMHERKLQLTVVIFLRAEVCCRHLRCLEYPPSPPFGFTWIMAQRAEFTCANIGFISGDSETPRLFELISQTMDIAQE